MRQFRKELTEQMQLLRIDAAFARRYVNDGFSGGEMKRAEILQIGHAAAQVCHSRRDRQRPGRETPCGWPARASRIGGRQMGILIITHHEPSCWNTISPILPT